VGEPRGPEGRALLDRIVADNPDPTIRGRACLALAFSKAVQARREMLAGESRPPATAEAKEIMLQESAVRAATAAAEIERDLKRAADEFPAALLEPDVAENFGVLSDELGPAAEWILLRIAEAHPLAEVRRDALCSLALQQMQLASLVAELKFEAVRPESERCAGVGIKAARASGGEARLKAVDSRELAAAIERRLKEVADGVDDRVEPGLCFRHLTTDSVTFAMYHAGVEALLRRIVERPSDRSIRNGARRSLALYLAGLAELSRSIDSERSYWVDRLGEDRVDQIRGLDRDRLRREASALADVVSRENQETGRPADAKIEKLRIAKATGAEPGDVR